MKDVNCKIGNDFKKCLLWSWVGAIVIAGPLLTLPQWASQIIAFKTKINIMPKIKNHRQTCE